MANANDPISGSEDGHLWAFIQRSVFIATIGPCVIPAKAGIQGYKGYGFPPSRE